MFLVYQNAVIINLSGSLKRKKTAIVAVWDFSLYAFGKNGKQGNGGNDNPRCSAVVFNAAIA